MFFKRFEYCKYQMQLNASSSPKIERNSAGMADLVSFSEEWCRKARKIKHGAKKFWIINHSKCLYVLKDEFPSYSSEGNYFKHFWLDYVLLWNATSSSDLSGTVSLSYVHQNREEGEKVIMLWLMKTFRALSFDPVRSTKTLETPNLQNNNVHLPSGLCCCGDAVA